MSKQRLITGLVLASVLLGHTGCARRSANPAGADIPAAPVVQPGTPLAPGVDPGPISPPPGTPYPGDHDGDGDTDMPGLPDPGAFPDPPPATQKPTAPGQTSFEAKAVAHTTYFNLPIPPYVRGNFCYINVTWQPVPGAKEFWLYKGGNLPAKEAASRETAYAIRPAGVLGGGVGFNDGTTPPSLLGGGFLEKVKRLGAALTIRPGIKQQYKIIAVDENGTPFAESPTVDSTPLMPIAPPVLVNVTDTDTAKPFFAWDDMKLEGQPEVDPANQPDGYYVAVFPSFNGAQGVTMPNAVAAWATFRDKRVKVARYGQENMSNQPYPGTLPFATGWPLKMNQTYAWTVISSKTDTGNMLTAKAVAKSWGMVQNFNIGTPPVSGPVSSDPGAGSGSGSGTSSGGSSGGIGGAIESGKQVASQASGIWSKLKGIFGK